MPFNIAEAKKCANALRAYERYPGGSVMIAGAGLLDAAIADAVNGMAQVRSAEAETVKFKKSYEDALLEIKELREKVTLGESAVEMLKVVSTMKKGAASSAAGWLVEKGVVKAEASKA